MEKTAENDGGVRISWGWLVAAAERVGMPWVLVAIVVAGGAYSVRWGAVNVIEPYVDRQFARMDATTTAIETNAEANQQNAETNRQNAETNERLAETMEALTDHVKQNGLLLQLLVDGLRGGGS